MWTSFNDFISNMKSRFQRSPRYQGIDWSEWEKNPYMLSPMGQKVNLQDWWNQHYNTYFHQKYGDLLKNISPPKYNPTSKPMVKMMNIPRLFSSSQPAIKSGGFGFNLLGYNPSNPSTGGLVPYPYQQTHMPTPSPGVWTTPTPGMEGGNVDLSSAWNQLASWSIGGGGGRSSSWHSGRSISNTFGGLEGDVRESVKGLLQNITSGMPGLISDVINAQPNENVLANLVNLTDLAKSDWVRNVRPIYDRQMKDAITSLANRGILDSSVASNLLGQLSGQYLTDYGNMLSNLEKYRIGTALEYPMRSAGLLGNLMNVAGGLSRITRSLGRSYSSGGGSSANTSFHYSYNPSAAIGLLSALLGL